MTAAARETPLRFSELKKNTCILNDCLLKCKSVCYTNTKEGQLSTVGKNDDV